MLLASKFIMSEQSKKGSPMKTVLSIVTLLFVLPVSAAEICECFGPFIEGHPNYIGTMQKNQCLSDGNEVGRCWSAADPKRSPLELISQIASSKYCSCYSYRLKNNTCTAVLEFRIENDSTAGCNSVCGVAELYDSPESAIAGCKSEL